MEALAFQQRSAQARIQRQSRHGAAKAGDAPLIIRSLQLLEQSIAVIESARIGRVYERKILRAAQSVVDWLRKEKIIGGILPGDDASGEWVCMTFAGERIARLSYGETIALCVCRAAVAWGREKDKK